MVALALAACCFVSSQPLDVIGNNYASVLYKSHLPDYTSGSEETRSLLRKSEEARAQGSIEVSAKRCEEILKQNKLADEVRFYCTGICAYSYERQNMNTKAVELLRQLAEKYRGQTAGMLAQAEIVRTMIDNGGSPDIRDFSPSPDEIASECDKLNFFYPYEPESIFLRIKFAGYLHSNHPGEFPDITRIEQELIAINNAIQSVRDKTVDMPDAKRERVLSLSSFVTSQTKGLRKGLAMAASAEGKVPAERVLDEQGKRGQDFGTFAVSKLTCVIGNNLGNYPHRQRYNGIFSMTSPDESVSPFVPDYAGINLEHYFDARPRSADNNIFFEPRNFPITFKKTSQASAELHQAATPFYKVESWTTFTLAEPHYVDVTFKCMPTENVFEGGYFGVFWASYINGPLDKSMYFLGQGSTLDAPKWVQLCTAQHGRDSTVRQEGDTAELPMPPASDTLYQSMSPLRFSVPFFYGRFKDMVLIYMWKPNPHLRLAHSPSGGGDNAAKDAQCPAWDFQLVVPNYEVGKEYGWELRLAYKPWKDRADVLNEVRAYLKN